MSKTKLLVIAGPTAVGKTYYSIKLAQAFDGEIVSCDSMQLYKYMNIGSAKPTKEEQAQAPHHLIDFLDPRDDFSVAKYQEIALKTIEDIALRGKLPIIAGGTGLYLNSLLYKMDFAGSSQDKEYRQELELLAEREGSMLLHNMLYEKDPEAAETIHPNNKKKLIRALERLHQGEDKLHQLKNFEEKDESINDDIDPILICLTRNREELYHRINRRVDILIEEGLIEEVQALMSMGLKYDDISMKGIGYKEIIEYLEGKVSKDEAIDNIKKNTRHYAKRQLTWFRRYDKMKWVNLSEYLNEEEALEEMINWTKEKIL